MDKSVQFRNRNPLNNEKNNDSPFVYFDNRVSLYGSIIF